MTAEDLQNASIPADTIIYSSHNRVIIYPDQAHVIEVFERIRALGLTEEVTEYAEFILAQHDRK